MRRVRLIAVCVALSVTADAAWSQSPFAARVVFYDPAPGQFVQNGAFNVPENALGSPLGGTLLVPNNTSIVSLGAFGGSITLAYDHTVVDHPLNPFGMDAIVFGNAFYSGGDPQTRWAEVATIEISRDANGNGEADDEWYLIPGSHIDVVETAFLIVTWDANISDSTFPPGKASWLPEGAIGAWETGNYELSLELFGQGAVENPSPNPEVEGIYGYADFSPTLLLGDLDGNGSVDDASLTAEVFYSTADDPFAVGITAGSGGGDAFDIAWAVDQETGQAAKLDGFDFIRITSAVAVLDGPAGEVSAEVDAVSDAAPDLLGDADGDEDIDLSDLRAMLACFNPGSFTVGGCTAFSRASRGALGLDQASRIIGRMIGPEWGMR